MFYSLIIPCYNEEDTIDSVLERSKSFVDEIIVVDDGSVDETGRILRNRKDIILIENERRRGQEKSIEKGIKHSKGDVIITMDADLEHHPEDIPRFKQFLVENNLDMVIGKRKSVPREGERRLNKIFEREYNITDVMNGFRVFKREIFEEVGCYSKNGFYGLSFLIEALENYKVGQIDISETERRKNARIGEASEVEKELNDIIRYVKKRWG